MQELCDQTLYDIMYERGRIVKFEPGQLVMECHVRSPLNVRGRELYDSEFCSHMRAEANHISNKQALVDSDQITSSVLGNFFAMVNLNAKQRRENGEEDFSKLWSKPKLRVEGNPP